MPFVIDLGKYSEVQTLFDHVKLEEGDNITITRDPAHNSLIIAAVCPPCPPTNGFSLQKSGTGSAIQDSFTLEIGPC